MGWLAQRTKEAKRRAEVIVIYSPEGAGKTSFATNFAEPTFAMSENETGLLTLMSKGLIDPVNYFPEFKTWEEVREATVEMIESGDRPRTFVLDTIGGVQALLIDFICREKYGGEMDRKGFLNYQEGWSAMAPVWRAWLSDLERLRNKGTTVVLLSHAEAINFKNPEGPDYHRYQADLHPNMWAPVKKFADLVCFLNFFTAVAGGDVAKGTKGTGQGGLTRVYQFQRTAAYDAKNRHNLPASMPGKGDAFKDFEEFKRLVKAGEAEAKSTKAKAKPKDETTEPKK